ncbi:MAG: ribosome biogenesis GTP-binding protein YihA/YsxC [Candidatus Hydrogenedentota bacterium]
MGYTICDAKFITSWFGDKLIDLLQLSQIAFAGRSNVGKSSLINVLCNKKRLAIVSKTPGKTRYINFFGLKIKHQDKFYTDRLFVDIPGYGFAKISKILRLKWEELLNVYFKNAHGLKIIVLIIDSNVGLTLLDKILIEWLKDLNINFIITANKFDKLQKSVGLALINKTRNEYTGIEVIPVSAKTRYNIDYLRNFLLSFIMS